MDEECNICTFEIKERIFCKTCKKDICISCYSKLVDEICPFCREPYIENENEEDDILDYNLSYAMFLVFWMNSGPELFQVFSHS
jgi:hypothetical protein